jgi:hypothetical protein
MARLTSATNALNNYARTNGGSIISQQQREDGGGVPTVFLLYCTVRVREATKDITADF